MENSRIIGISHRVKRSATGEARPTQVAILQNGEMHGYNLKTENDELAFVDGEFALGTELFDGLQPGDQVVMMLGGSGDNFASALTRRGMEIGAYVYRVPPFVLSKYTPDEVPANNAHKVALLFLEHSEAFYNMGAKELPIVWLRVCLSSRTDAMKARIACEQRIGQHLIGEIFCSPRGHYPEGTIEKQLAQRLANDAVYSPLVKEEERRNAQLAKACEEIPVYNEVFSQVVGCGPMIASRIISAVIDIRRFIVEADPEVLAASKTESLRLEAEAKLEADTRHVGKLILPGMTHYEIIQLVRDWKRNMGKEKEAQLLDRSLVLHEERSKLRRKAMNKSIARFQAFCGVHVRDGQFPRRRNNQTANWHNDCRMALYLLGDQFNRRPESYWGQKLLAAKEKYRLAHPEVVISENGKKRYTPGHILKMAKWYTLNKFAKWLFREWIKLEKAGTEAE